MSVKSTFLKINLLLTLSMTACLSANAQSYTSPDILVLGDSQITFGAGPSFLKFFQNLKQNCGGDQKTFSKLGKQSVAVIGVRSTSLGTWAKTTKKGKGPICDVDPKWKVNAGSYGTVNSSKNIYVQIGKGAPYQFCKKNKSAFDAMFENNYYDPKLLFLTFLGNSSATWAKDRNSALADVKAAMADIPKDMPCVFMTTAPTYQKKIVDQRLKAQKNLEWAFKKTGSQCTFVRGFTPQTIAANLGNKKHFRLKKSGAVKDPFHPNKAAARKFFALQKRAICSAVKTQLDKN